MNTSPDMPSTRPMTLRQQLAKPLANLAGRSWRNGVDKKPYASIDSLLDEATADIEALCQERFRAGQLDCQKAGDPTNHTHFAEACQEIAREALTEASDKFDELHQGTPGAGYVHYGEMGEWFDERIAELTQKPPQEPK